MTKKANNCFSKQPLIFLLCMYTFAFRHQQSSRDLKYNQEFPHEDRYGDQEDEVELDEFGRQRAPQNLSRKAPDEWPPCFETHGSSYVFDTRCAMFYQSDSGFFYDPKTKLYYGNKQGAYFRYDESKKPPFEQVQNAILGSEESSNLLDPIISSKSTDRNKKDAGKKRISIKLKSETLASAKQKKKEKVVADVKQAPVPPAPGSSRVQKQYGAAMDKWSERQVEKEIEVKQQEKSKEKVKVVKTIKGQPICLLCKRKFPTIEKLHYHEKASALHQENLAKQASLINTESSDLSRSDYVDRAQQRRAMHGMESSSMTAPSLRVPAASPHTSPAGFPPTTHPSENLGQTNIGNQMLQKLGWKSGDSLGRQGGDANQNVVQNAIVKDWEKIEAIARNGGKGQHPSASRRRR
jgi:RNA-binding protein 5/10